MKWSISTLTGQSKAHLISLKDQWVHALIASDLIALIQAAEQAGFQFTIVSSFRDFDRQSMIWDLKYTGQRPVLDDTNKAVDLNTLSERDKIKAILRWSALPGASRHHWGTDLDVCAQNLLPPNTALQLEPWEYLSGHQAPFYQWLCANMAQYGFYFPYDIDRGGVGIEPWHISHYAVSQTAFAHLTRDNLAPIIEKSKLAGKACLLKNLDWIFKNYIHNVNTSTPTDRRS